MYISPPTARTADLAIRFFDRKSAPHATKGDGALVEGEVSKAFVDAFDHSGDRRVTKAEIADGLTAAQRLGLSEKVIIANHVAESSLTILGERKMGWLQYSPLTLPVVGFGCATAATLIGGAEGLAAVVGVVGGGVFCTVVLLLLLFPLFNWLFSKYGEEPATADLLAGKSDVSEVKQVWDDLAASINVAKKARNVPTGEPPKRL